MVAMACACHGSNIMLHDVLMSWHAVQILGHGNTLAYEPWPELDESHLVEDTFTLPVQVSTLIQHPVPSARRQLHALN